MTTALLSLDELPRQNASSVKNKWGEVVRQVQQLGSLAITNHATVEMVLLNAATALIVAGRTPTLTDGAAMAAETLDSGAAATLLDRWIAYS